LIWIGWRGYPRRLWLRGSDDHHEQLVLLGYRSSQSGHRWGSSW
jgi:hypothetical protein